MTVDKNLKKVGIKQPKAYYKKKQETLTALKKRIKERKKELSDWIESDGSDATDNEMLQHNFLVDIENELKKLETEQSDNELLTELGNAIRAGKVKIDWIEDCEEYNEEEDIKGLYTDTFYLSLI